MEINLVDYSIPHSELPACSTKRYMNYHQNLSQQIKQINSIEHKNQIFQRMKGIKDNLLGG